MKKLEKTITNDTGTQMQQLRRFYIFPFPLPAFLHGVETILSVVVVVLLFLISLVLLYKNFPVLLQSLPEAAFNGCMAFHCVCMIQSYSPNNSHCWTGQLASNLVNVLNNKGAAFGLYFA